MRKPNGSGGTDGNEFVGFIPDLMDRLSHIIGFRSYEIRIVVDGKYGSKRNDGSWSGMIAELIRGVGLR